MVEFNYAPFSIIRSDQLDVIICIVTSSSELDSLLTQTDENYYHLEEANMQYKF